MCYNAFGSPKANIGMTRPISPNGTGDLEIYVQLCEDYVAKTDIQDGAATAKMNKSILTTQT